MIGKKYARLCIPAWMLRARAIRRNKTALAKIAPVGQIVCPLECSNELNPGNIFCRTDYEAEWKNEEQKISRFSIPDTAHGVDPGSRRAIYYLIRHLQPRSVLEVGTHIGASTVHIASALRKCQTESPKETFSMTTVDIADVNDPKTEPWRGFGSSFSPREMLRRLGCERITRFETSDSLEYFSRCRETYNLIFLDGSHHAAHVYQELSAALQVLDSGGWLLLHDFFPNLKPLWSNGKLIPGPWLATERLRSEGFPLSAIPLGKLPWHTKLNSNVTCLALLGRSRSAAEPKKGSRNRLFHRKKGSRNRLFHRTP